MTLLTKNVSPLQEADDIPNPILPLSLIAVDPPVHVWPPEGGHYIQRNIPTLDQEVTGT